MKHKRSDAIHAVITGGTGGLGSAIATNLEAEGWQVAAPGSASLDVRDESAVTSFFHGREVDLLVCAAGLTLDAPMARLTDSAWEQTIEVNYHGAARCARAVLPGMIERGRGHVIFVSSHSAIRPPVGQSAYAAAKAALLGLTADLSRRHGGSNIRVNVILPGFLETRMTSKLGSSRAAEVLKQHALGRLNTCEAVAEFVCFLHDHLPHTSGQVFQLDSRPNFSC